MPIKTVIAGVLVVLVAEVPLILSVCNHGHAGNLPGHWS